MITINSSTWLATLPRLIEPLPDEWLPGLLLRCDRANGWTCRTTAQFLFRRRDPNPNGMIPLLGACAYDLAQLSSLLSVSEQRLLETTWRQELYRYYGTEEIPFDNARLRLRICPKCIADQGLLRKELAFPDVFWCPIHAIELQHACRCGAALRLGNKTTQPFTCSVCENPWSTLPQQPASAEDLVEQAECIAVYEAVLRWGSPYLAEHGLLYIIDRRLALGPHPEALALLPVPDTVFEHNLMEGPPLPFLRFVDYALNVGIAAHEFKQLAVPCREFCDRCPNYGCPWFGRHQGGNIHPYDAKRRIPHWYCAICGSIFTENRLVASFDEDCRPPKGNGVYPLSRERRAHAEQWQLWRDQLHYTIHPYFSRFPPQIPPRDVLWQKAGIPNHPRYAAPHLGLTEETFDKPLQKRRKAHLIKKTE